MTLREATRQRLVEIEADYCAALIFLEITGGSPRPENWYRWFLCERHGGAPLVDSRMPRNQIAYWDGEDIVVDAYASIAEIAAALPEELTHRLSSRETPRFERINDLLRHARTVERAVFQEMVGQRVSALFEQALLSAFDQPNCD